MIGFEKQGQKINQQQKLPKNFRLVYYFAKKEYLGAAHGVFGILNILMQGIQQLTQQNLINFKQKEIVDIWYHFIYKSMKNLLKF